MFGDDSAIITGLTTIDNHKFVLIGHQKGRDAKRKSNVILECVNQRVIEKH